MARGYETVRTVVFDYLRSGFGVTVRGNNGKYAQMQGYENCHAVYGLYKENGDYARETPDANSALDWIGLEKGEYK